MLPSISVQAYSSLEFTPKGNMKAASIACQLLEFLIPKFLMIFSPVRTSKIHPFVKERAESLEPLDPWVPSFLSGLNNICDIHINLSYFLLGNIVGSSLFCGFL